MNLLFDIHIGEPAGRILSRSTNSVKNQPTESPYKCWYLDKLKAHPI